MNTLIHPTGGTGSGRAGERASWRVALVGCGRNKSAAGVTAGGRAS